MRRAPAGPRTYLAAVDAGFVAVAAGGVRELPDDVIAKELGAAHAVRLSRVAVPAGRAGYQISGMGFEMQLEIRPGVTMPGETAHRR